MSPWMSLTRSSLSAFSRLRVVPRDILSRMTISAGFSLRRSWSIVVEPMRPAPPVTRILEPSIFIVPSPVSRWRLPRRIVKAPLQAAGLVIKALRRLQFSLLRQRRNRGDDFFLLHRRQFREHRDGHRLGGDLLGVWEL